MDKPNKIVLSEEYLQYFYKVDKALPVGETGMVDDTLAVSMCGRSAKKPNSVNKEFLKSRIGLPYLKKIGKDINKDNIKAQSK